MSELNKQLLEAINYVHKDYDGELLGMQDAANACEEIFYEKAIVLLKAIQQGKTDINMAILQLQEQLKQLNQ